MKRTASVGSEPRSSEIPTKLIILMVAGLGVLLAIAVLWGLVLRDRDLVGAGRLRFGNNGAHLSAGREFRRVYGDRLRVALDERGVEVAIVGLGIATAVVLGVLIAG